MENYFRNDPAREHAFMQEQARKWEEREAQERAAQSGAESARVETAILNGAGAAGRQTAAAADEDDPPAAATRAGGIAPRSRRTPHPQISAQKMGWKKPQESVARRQARNARP